MWSKEKEEEFDSVLEDRTVKRPVLEGFRRTRKKEMSSWSSPASPRHSSVPCYDRAKRAVPVFHIQCIVLEHQVGKPFTTPPRDIPTIWKLCSPFKLWGRQVYSILAFFINYWSRLTNAKIKRMLLISCFWRWILWKMWHCGTTFKFPFLPSSQKVFLIVSNKHRCLYLNTPAQHRG